MTQEGIGRARSRLGSEDQLHLADAGMPEAQQQQQQQQHVVEYKKA